MKITKLIIIYFLICCSFQLIAKEDISNDSLLVFALNNFDYESMDTLNFGNSKLNSIKDGMTSVTLSYSKLNKLLINISDWNRDSEFRIVPNIKLLQLLSANGALLEDNSIATMENDGEIKFEDNGKNILLSNNYSYLFGLSSLLGLILFSLFFYKRIIKMDKLINKNLNNQTFEDWYRDTVRPDIAKLEGRIKKLELEINSIKAKSADGKERHKHNEIHSTVTDEVIDNNKTVLYARNINGNVFIKTKPNREGNLYFKLEVIKDEGTYYIIDDEETHRDLVSYGADLLETTCKSINSISDFSKRIRTIRPGQIKKTGLGWEILQKIEIKYE